MSVLLFLVALATNHKVQLRGFGHETIQLHPHDTVEATVVTPGLTLLIPRVEGFFAEVYQPREDANILAGSITAKNSAIGAFFPSTGKVLITASAPANLTYFTFDNPKHCVRFIVSTSAIDFFSAVEPPTDGNLTIQNNQRVCILHVSDAPVDVDMKYSTEEDYDILYFRSGDKDEVALSGTGEHHASDVRMSQFVWVSDKTMLSKSFDITWKSASTLPPLHSNFSAHSWASSSSAEIIYDYERSASSATKMEYENARVNWYSRTDNEVVVNLIIMSILGMFLLLVLILLGMFCWKWQQQTCAPKSMAVDGSLVGMLRQADAAGVNTEVEQREPEQCPVLPEPLPLDVSEIDEIVVQ